MKSACWVAAAAITLGAPALAFQGDGQRPVEWSDAYVDFVGNPTAPFFMTYRNFTGASAGGHADFGKAATNGPGRYVNIIADQLDSEGKPVFRSSGNKLTTEWMDAVLRPIISPRSWIDARGGDVVGSASGTTGGAVTSSATLAQWFRDVSGVNSRTDSTLNFNHAGAGVYIFDGSLDSQLGSPDFDYSAEMFWYFVHERGRGGFLTADTDAEVWAFIDDRLVIDGGRGSGALGLTVQGLAVKTTVRMNGGAVVKAAPGSTPAVITNSTSNAAIELNSGCSITGDALVGPGGNPASVIRLNGGSTITGVRAAQAAPFVFPTVTAPSGMGPVTGQILLNSGQSITVNSNRHLSSVSLNSSCNLYISGHVTMLVDGDFVLNSSCHLHINANSSLQLYVGGNFNLNAGCSINANTQDASKVTLYMLSNRPVLVNSGVGMYANTLAPQSELTLNSNCVYDGNFVGASAMLNSGCRFTAHATAPWAGASVGAVPAPRVRHTIELDRLSWLDDKRTCQMRVFVANRTGLASQLRMETNCRTMGVINCAKTLEGD